MQQILINKYIQCRGIRLAISCVLKAVSFRTQYRQSFSAGLSGPETAATPPSLLEGGIVLEREIEWEGEGGVALLQYTILSYTSHR